ncbi:hypothetical protein KP509_11G090800 [Ceratopteris richardii]|uniref:Uncharacterized protein n=1 Tax=Ceratopteris richardii TaxID=49495 RepID=A0A8T2TXA9_CERRI|nr:hypothetical protein KP509_11G090800 [Ceratopteris richardii]
MQTEIRGAMRPVPGIHLMVRSRMVEIKESQISCTPKKLCLRENGAHRQYIIFFIKDKLAYIHDTGFEHNDQQKRYLKSRASLQSLFITFPMIRALKIEQLYIFHQRF